MKKIRIGVFGLYRGTSMINYCMAATHAQVVAICDKWEEGIARKKEQLQDDSITFYTSFDEFIKHDMDAVVLANYANEHAPFAIRCMKDGKHVFSEVLPVQTMRCAGYIARAKLANSNTARANTSIIANPSGRALPMAIPATGAISCTPRITVPILSVRSCTSRGYGR